MDVLQTWVSLSKINEIPDGVTAFKKKRKNLAVYKKDGKIIKIFEDDCPHNNRIKISSDYRVENDTITCAFHGACWKLQDGQTVKGPGGEGLHLFEYRVLENNMLEVLIS